MFAGAVAYVPVALVAGYASWNYWVAILLVIALSYGLCSRRVVVGLDFVAIRKFGPYRLAPADSIISGALQPSQRGGVLKTGHRRWPHAPRGVQRADDQQRVARAGAQDRPHLRLRRSALLAASGGGVPTA